ncbi:MAG TPA: TIGR00730 family Rossman fold protein [Alphaproteobacteria bacterium]|nr:TIGR00730 family Rossman fold protein [Micavibrio sp.]MBK9562741.1 TIGR00730 family Rossman fold protein [Micavibrio sp.]HQX26561.1 TIGR00730 family Rossman fold protein [Alphaproteobacteria bacterium]
MTILKTLTVYLGSSGRARPVFQDSAADLGRIIGESGYHLVYGGMDAGLMGQIASGAQQAGGKVTGIVPRKLQDSERILKDLTETVLVEDLWQRKKKMFELADAIVSLPGGFGTLDETLEVLYWGKLKLHTMPLVLVNIENYWAPLIAFLRTLRDFDQRFLIVVDSIEGVIPALKAWDAPSIEKQDGHFPHFEDEIMRKTGEPIIIDTPSVENAYYVACALGLKQLGKHTRPIGFLNKDGQFDALLNWFERAALEHFITDKCLKLFDAAPDEKTLQDLLKNQHAVSIDLHKEKWGERREKARP